MSVVLSGFDGFQKKLTEMPRGIARRANAIVIDSAREWAQLAKKSAPVDQGGLIGRIQAVPKGELSAEVISPAAHSRFIEFGTKARKKVPADLASYEASLSYQKSGDYYDFLNAILDWVKRKGLARITNSYTGRSSTKKNDLLMVAEAVAHSISRHGSKPHPFLFPHKSFIESKMMNRLKSVVKL